MSQAEDARPVYRKIADDLRAEIFNGTYAPGDRLPGENALMKQYNVARMTARQALGVLAGEGLTEARTGSGVYVRSFTPIRRSGITRLSASQWGAGRSIWDSDTEGRNRDVDQLVVVEAPIPANVAHVLQVDENSRGWRRDRRYTVDKKPVMLSTSWLPADLVDGSPITQPDTGPGGIYARLADLGHAPVHAVEEIQGRMPSAEEAERLRLGAGTPVIVIARTAFDSDRRPVEFNFMVLDSSVYLLDYEFDL